MQLHTVLNGHGTTTTGRVLDRSNGLEVDSAALAGELARRIRGEVRFDAGDRAMYATDGSNYRHVPIGVVIPRTVEDVVQTVRICREHGAPVLPRGGGTSLAGQCCNVAVVIDFSKYLNQVLSVDAELATVRVLPGVLRDRVTGETERHGLTFAPDTATHRWATIGGMLGNNSCGIHSVMAGRTEDNVEELDILLYDGFRMRVGATSEPELDSIIRHGGRRGEIYGRLRDLRDRYAGFIRERYPRIPRRVSGYSLDELLPEKGFHVARLLVGSEGTLATILEATLRLVPSPAERVLLVLGYPDVYHAADHVPEVLEAGPTGLEGLDDRLMHFLERKDLHRDKIPLFPEGKGWLLVEFGGDTIEEAAEKARALMRRVQRSGDAPTMELYEDREHQAHIWEVRESGLGATAFIPGREDTWEGWEDAAVPPDRVGEYLRDFRKLYDRYGYDGSVYGHFGDGCIHTRTNFDLTTAAGIRKYRAFAKDAADLVVRYGGSLSGEHGDGQSRSELLDRMYGRELIRAFGEFKEIWDPDHRMNPGRIVDPFRLDEHLRLGVDYNPPEPDTQFAYPEDQGSFARATLRCVGVGKCRKMDGGTMCPSYMVLREEMHTTRGRAHLLFEMLQGDPVRNGWRDEKVKESLDLCLSCKGCTGECPVNVDIPTYKAEFLSHYYSGRLRPREAYAFGLIPWWSRIASLAPRIVNAVTHAPGLSTLAKAAAGMPQQREIPRFATRTFRSWFHRRTDGNVTGPEVILWPDTFNNFFHPEIARAAVEVLEDAGCHVTLPRQTLCCGRPLYEFGMLDLAKRQLRQILSALRPQIRAGVPVVGLEPSCVSVFRDELPKLFPHDHDARRLRQQTFTLSEYLGGIAYEPPRMRRKVIVHGHCHDKAVLNRDSEDRLFERMGLDFRILDSGCCGMAGAFGFEKEKYDVSIGAGERALLPAVREADADTLIVTNGFSCREQVEQCTGRRPLHFSELLQLALRRSPERRGPTPAAGLSPAQHPAGLIPALPNPLLRAATLAGGVAAGSLLIASLRGRSP
jgi:FAD/FMN-containing dehydrogenase/Fe-S oxidoreductase